MVLIIVILVAAIVVANVIVFNVRVRSFVLRILGRLWHFVTRKHIEMALTNFGETINQGFIEIKRNPKFGLILAGVVLGDETTSLT